MDPAARTEGEPLTGAGAADRRIDGSAWDDACVRLDHELTGLTPTESEIQNDLPGMADRAPDELEPGASNPAVAELQREAMGIIQQWLERVRSSEAQTLGHVEAALDEIEELRDRVEHVLRELEACQRNQGELETNQRKVAETVATLHERVRGSMELGRSNAAWLESLVQKPGVGEPSTIEMLAQRVQATEERSTHALIAAGICFLVALIAMIVAAVR